MATAIYPGTFDPITHGHIDIVQRAAKIFKHVVAVVAENPGKNPLFNGAEREVMAKEALAHLSNVTVVRWAGLIVKCMETYDATAIIRGLRAVSDFEYEFQMALTNRNMNRKAETVFLMPNEQFIYLNSSMVKQIARLGGDVSGFVPPCILKHIEKKLAIAQQKPSRRRARPKK